MHGRRVYTVTDGTVQVAYLCLRVAAFVDDEIQVPVCQPVAMHHC